MEDLDMQILKGMMTHFFKWFHVPFYQTPETRVDPWLLSFSESILAKIISEQGLETYPHHDLVAEP